MKEMTKVLVVDDDPRMVKTICDILKAKGYIAVPAFSGDEAMEKVSLEKPDCVLMDIKMPGLDGVGALKMMLEQAPSLPVVLMSAYATEEQAEEIRRMGACSLLTKPVDIEQLLSFLSLIRKEENILVVDDDPQFCSLLMDSFQSRNYRVETEDDPEKALALMEQKHPLVVVLDLKLGDADGADVMQDIRERYPSKPVVLVTGCRDEMAASIEKGLRIGAYTCLYKPFRVEELVAIIEEISRKKLRDVLDETS
jgi:two-component system response regulator HydG